MAMASALLIGAALSLSATGFYQGSFEEVQSTGAPCDGFFAPSEYRTRLVLAGPTRRTALVRFDAETGAGFFDGLTLVGLLGGSNDLYYEKSVTKDGVTADLVAEGFASYDVLYLELRLAARDAAGTPLCTASAVYSGFN